MRHFRFNGRSKCSIWINLDRPYSYYLKPLIWVVLAFICLACQPTQNPKSTEHAQNFVASAHTSSSNFKASVTDSSGAKVVIHQPVQRVVCLFESGCDGLYMLHQGSKIVGIPAEIYQQPMLYQAYAILDPRIRNKSIATPAQGSNTVNLESLLLLKPDLVIMGSGEKQTIALLRQLGIAVYIMESATYAQVKKELTDIATLMNAKTRAQTILALSDRKIAEIQHHVAKIPKQQTVYYAWSGGRIFSTSGTESITNDFIELAGAKNIVTTKTNQPNVNPETLIEWNPDNIVLWNTQPQLITQRPELQGLNAVKQHKVFNLSPAFMYNPHTIKIVLTALYLHQNIYSQQQDDILNTQLEMLQLLYGQSAAKALLSL